MPIDRCAFRAIPAAVALALCATGAAANPQGGVVKAGSATITPNGSRLDVIQSSQRAVIDWRSFSIGAGGHVDFKQPSAASATLNRVTGPQASALLGRLTANGTVFLVNPNGILIGPGAKIDVGGLVAATANISNENFMAGRYKFDEVVNRNAVIVNRGEITAHAGGLVALVAPGVENSGVIRAELGRVVLASGNRFTLDLFGDKLVAFAVDDKVAARLTDVEGRPLKAYVNQTGRIEADGGSILIAASAAKAVLDNVINTGGVVRATSFAQRGGEIVLHGGDEGAVRVAGTLDASGRAAGASGGSVKVLGAEVVLEAGSRIDVAGDAGGGTALVGGGVQGSGGVPRSSRTVIEAGATVSADALARGNGGAIVAWSDGDTRFAGALSARGGPGGGDGGFVEVSGKRELAFAGAVDAGAPAGRGGRLLLDPELLIVDAAVATGAANTLRSGTRVDLDATDAIEVRAPIDGRGGASGAALTLTAGNRIAVDSDLVTNDGAVLLKAGIGGITMHAPPGTPITQGQGTVIHAGKAEIVLEAAGNVTAEHLVTTGALKLESRAGSVTLNRDLGGTLGEGIASLSVSAGKDVSLKGVRTTGAVSVNMLNPAGTITLDGPIVAGKDVIIGSPALAASTSIMLRNDIHTDNADIELNGRTWIGPIVRSDNVTFLAPPFSPSVFLSIPDQTLFENVLVQVSVQTTGLGNVRFNGDVLWDGARIPTMRYIYGVAPPPGFDRADAAAVEKVRGLQPERPVRNFGLNVGLESGAVYFGGNIGTFDAAGASTATPAPIGTLGGVNTGNGLWVSVTNLGTPISFRSASNKVEVSRFDIVYAADTAFSLQVADPEFLPDLFPLPRPSFSLLPGLNLPQVRVDGGDPTLVGPGPHNVAAARRFEAAAALPELPIMPATFAGSGPTPPGPSVSGTALLAAPTPEPAAVLGVTGNSPPESIAQSREAATRGDATARSAEAEAPETLAEPLRGADLGRAPALHGAAQEVFQSGAPLVPLTPGASAAADHEYFSEGPFEYVQTLSRRASR